jgi:hypothetical protein
MKRKVCIPFLCSLSRLLRGSGRKSLLEASLCINFESLAIHSRPVGGEHETLNKAKAKVVPVLD